MSDWSSDVCSSDLPQRVGKARSAISAQVIVGWRFHLGSARPHRHGRQADAVEADSGEPPLRAKRCSDARPRRARDFVAGHVKARDSGRSEEHTSELQSLMRISYAVFCLQKKNT